MPEGYHDVEISNLALIGSCWGAAAADQVVGHIRLRLHHLGLRAVPIGDRGGFRIVANLRRPGAIDQLSLADLPYRLSAEPVWVELGGDHRAMVHAVISWQCDNLPRYRSPRDIQSDHQERWFAVYKSDMQIVSYLFRCMREGRLAPHWQPVSDYRDPVQILYHEGLVRFSDEGEALSPAVIFPALERIGLASTFDWLMVGHVIQELERDPGATLGVNISASSAHLHGWWTGVLADLERRPAVAQRLVVEITETEPLIQIAQAAAFASRLRACGVTLALDDFGAGYTAICHLMTLKPSFVKVDGSFLRSASAETARCDALPHLIALIRELGGTVIVEGVETQAMAELAYVSGAMWQQGYHHGRPAPARSGMARPSPGGYPPGGSAAL